MDAANLMNERTYTLMEINSLLAKGETDSALRLYDEVVDYNGKEFKKETFISKFITKMGL